MKLSSRQRDNLIAALTQIETGIAGVHASLTGPDEPGESGEVKLLAVEQAKAQALILLVQSVTVIGRALVGSAPDVPDPREPPEHRGPVGLPLS
jgi:hypothetical protein